MNKKKLYIKKISDRYEINKISLCRPLNYLTSEYQTIKMDIGDENNKNFIYDEFVYEYSTCSRCSRVGHWEEDCTAKFDRYGLYLL